MKIKWSFGAAYLLGVLGSIQTSSHSSKVQESSVDNYMVKFNNRNNRKRREICSKLTINTPERRTSITSFSCLYWGLWIYFTSCSSVFIVNFEQVNAGWILSNLKFWINPNNILFLSVFLSQVRWLPNIAQKLRLIN